MQHQHMDLANESALQPRGIESLSDELHSIARRLIEVDRSRLPALCSAIRPQLTDLLDAIATTNPAATSTDSSYSIISTPIRWDERFSVSDEVMNNKIAELLSSADVMKRARKEVRKGS
jgi:hypothetical protein